MNQPRSTTLARSAANLRKAAAGACALAMLAGLAGCEVDSFMDPSVLGRWEHTPTVVPILDRIATIEDQTGELVEYSDPTDADLIPVPAIYRLGPGDRVKVTAYDLIEPNRPEEYERVIDVRGIVELPQLGQIYVAGMTLEEAKAAIMVEMQKLVPKPLASIVALQQRQQTFTLLGAVDEPGPYFIPDADYRLLEALTAGRRFDSTVQYVYVIRQVRLPAEARGLKLPEPGAQPAQPKGEPGRDFIDIVNDITKPKDQPKPPGGSPGMFAQPESQPPNAPPPIDMPDATKPLQKGDSRSPAPPSGGGESGWVYLNGRWVQVRRPETPSAGGTPAPSGDLVTQRIIRVPLDGLLAGKREFNIIVRPGDVVRVPAPPQGFVYVSGQVARPGPYQFPTVGKGFTLLRALDAAGGLGTFAIPERIDLMRMIGHDRQATIRLNGRAIAEQTQPDIFLKPDDRINVGTNFWATPLAVIRNGFRASYGFGFIVDRNFAEEIFGLQKSQRIRGTVQ